MDVKVNLTEAGRNHAAITVTTSQNGWGTTEVLPTEAAERAIRDLQEALRAVRARRKLARTRGKAK